MTLFFLLLSVLLTLLAAPTFATCFVGNVNVAATTCGLGQYMFEGTTCETCPDGKWQPESKSIATNCYETPPGHFPTANQSSFEKCVAGTYNMYESYKCVPCTTARYPGSTTCKSYAENTRGRSRMLLTECDPGFHLDTTSDSCEPCAAGMYQAFSGSTDNHCHSAQPGYYADDGRSQKPCGGGSYSVGTGNTICTDCSQGRHQSEHVASTCVACTIGRFEGARASSKTACDVCGPGHYAASAASSCESCVRGKHNSQQMVSKCVSCTEGRYEPFIASHLAACADCGAGYYSLAMASECLPCNKGSFQPGNTASKCFDCPIGRFIATKASAAAQCEECGGGLRHRDLFARLMCGSQRPVRHPMRFKMEDI